LKPLYTLLGMILQYFIKLDFLDVSHSSWITLQGMWGSST
jgi:hypothetical protein